VLNLEPLLRGKQQAPVRGSAACVDGTEPLRVSDRDRTRGVYVGEAGDGAIGAFGEG
jgi:hypothetical protein